MAAIKRRIAGKNPFLKVQGKKPVTIPHLAVSGINRLKGHFDLVNQREGGGEFWLYIHFNLCTRRIFFIIQISIKFN
jgi:hypothetical protein